jgi:hypothetical protein
MLMVKGTSAGSNRDRSVAYVMIIARCSHRWHKLHSGVLGPFLKELPFESGGNSTSRSSRFTALTVAPDEEAFPASKMKCFLKPSSV